MPPVIPNVATGATSGSIAGPLGTAAGAVYGLATSIFDSNKQEQQSKDLMDYQEQKQKEIMQYGNGTQMALWNETNYPAQIEQMKAAGINPALIYSKGGGGASATTGSPTTGGGQPIAPRANTAGNIAGITGMIQQQEMLQESLDVMKAQANALNTHATKEGTVDTTNTIANTKNTQANTTKTNTETTFLSNTMADRAEQIALDRQTQQQKLQQETNIANIGNETWKAQVIQANAQAVNSILDLYLTQANTTKTNEETQNLKSQINQRTQQIAQDWSKIGIQQQQTELNGLKMLIDSYRVEGIPMNDWTKTQQSIEKILKTGIQ